MKAGSKALLSGIYSLLCARAFVKAHTHASRAMRGKGGEKKLTKNISN